MSAEVRDRWASFPIPQLETNQTIESNTFTE